MKKYLRCETDKPLCEFSRNRKAVDGLGRCCKDCDAARRGRTRQKPPRISLSDTQAAYLAGFIDGEGYLGLTKSVRRGGRYDGSPASHVQFRVGITSPVINQIRDECGFGRVIKSLARKPKHKDRLDWIVRASETRLVLPLLIPYLKIKKRQAELLVEYFALPRTRDDVYRTSLARIYCELSRLNRRGRHP